MIFTISHITNITITTRRFNGEEKPSYTKAVNVDWQEEKEEGDREIGHSTERARGIRRKRIGFLDWFRTVRCKCGQFNWCSNIEVVRRGRL